MGARSERLGDWDEYGTVVDDSGTNLGRRRGVMSWLDFFSDLFTFLILLLVIQSLALAVLIILYIRDSQC